jgi:Tol biopolymer transport system component
VSNRDGRWSLYAAPLAMAPVANPVLIARLDTLPSNLGMRPTGDGLVMNASYWESDVWRVDVDSTTGLAVGEPQRLTQEGNQNFLPSTSPDGRHVAYWSRHGYRMNLSVMDANGVNERIVRTTDQPTNHNFWTAPVWLSAEDVFFSTYSPLNDGERRFFTADIQTGTVEALPFPELLAVPRPPYRDWQVLPARNEMVFLAPGEAGNPAVLVSRPLSGGATRPIATLSVTRGQLENFLVSPDGRRIAFLSSGTWRVFDVQTRAVISALGNFGAPVDWSADGRYLLTDIGQRPTVFDTVDGKSWPLRDAAAAGINWWGDGSWSADRSFVVLSIIANREVWRQVVGMTSAEVARLAANPPRAGGQQPRR